MVVCEFYSTPVYYSNRRAAIAISEMDRHTKKKGGFYYLCEAKPPALAGSAHVSLQAAVSSASALKLEQPSTMYLAT